MKICIIQKQLFPYIGVMAISGVLKNKGYEVEALIDVCESDIISSLEKMSPDVIGFSVLSNEHMWLSNLSQKIKQLMPKVPIIVGGVHAVLYSEDILKIKGVDYVCCGDGEIALPLLLERLKNGNISANGITGIGYYDGDNPILQGITPMVQELDLLEDRSIYYDRYPVLRNLDLKTFLSGRGCPYKCSFCANPYIMNIYKGGGPYIRRKTPKHFITEIKDVVIRYGVKSVFICDDLFLMNIKWLEEFTDLYKSEIKIPYMVTGRADVLSEKQAKLLIESGCHTVSFGVETGNERLRKNILKKTVTDEDIIKCAGILKKFGIEVQTSNMFCLPDETIEDAISTIELNMKIKTDYMFTAIYLPFPKTELAEYCSQKNYLKSDYSFSDMPESFVMDSVLNIKDKEHLINLHKVAHLCIKFPILKPFLVYIAIKIRSKRLFFLLYILETFLRFKDERKLTFIQTVKYLWTYRKGY